MLVPRESPSVVAAGEKIYVFGSSCYKFAEGHLADVFNVELNRWDKLPLPPVASPLVHVSISDLVLLDSSRSQILVHFSSNNSLHAFHTDGGSWECMDPEFGMWSTASNVNLSSLFQPNAKLRLWDSKSRCSNRGIKGTTFLFWVN
ncbi:hypothetical protein V6N13_083460 [Hibiscus sabdariffa]